MLQLRAPDSGYLDLCVGAIPGLWIDRAACRGSDPEIFFLDKGHPGAYTAARELCARCPVLKECRGYVDRVEAETQSDRWFGMYAGETPNDRRRRRGFRANGSRKHSPQIRPNEDSRVRGA